jgi:hypothetical protein
MFGIFCSIDTFIKNQDAKDIIDDIKILECISSRKKVMINSLKKEILFSQINRAKQIKNLI